MSTYVPLLRAERFGLSADSLGLASVGTFGPGIDGPGTDGPGTGSKELKILITSFAFSKSSGFKELAAILYANPTRVVSSSVT